MATEGERIATLEAVIADLRGDVGEVKQEQLRNRTRLHNLEGLAGTLVEQEKRRNRDTAQHEARVNRTLQVLAAVVAIATFAEPFLYHAAGGG